VLAGIASTAWARRRSVLPRLAVLSGGDPGPLSRLGLVLAASGAVVPTITNVVVTHRYLGDFYPALAMGAVVAAPLLARTLLLRTGAWRAVVSVLVVLTVWSVAVNVAFTRMQGLV
jgi:hypothetical protein